MKHTSKEWQGVADKSKHTEANLPEFQQTLDTLKYIFKIDDGVRNAAKRADLQSNVPNIKDTTFLDKNGKEYILSADVQKQWIETFGLKNIDETYMPNLPQELRQELGKDLALKKVVY